MNEEIKTTKMKNTLNKVFSLEETKEIWKAGQEYWKTSGESKTFEETIESLGELLSDRRFTLEDMKRAIEIALNSSYVSTQLFSGHSTVKHNFTSDEIIQSLSQPKSWEVELEGDYYTPQSNGKISDGKITHEISLNPSLNTLFAPKLTNGKVKVLKLIK